MTLGWILRSIIRPIVHIHSVETWLIASRGEDHWTAPSVGIFCLPRDVPERAKSIRLLGDLTLAWWGAGARPAEKIYVAGNLTPEAAAEIARSLLATQDRGAS
jgi:hypothetical protein